MPQWLRHHLAILAVAGPILFIGLGDARLWDRDEPRNARCAVEMLERHDWIVPYFNGELRTHKPVLLYWLIMSSYAVFGVGEFAARFPSAVLGLGTVFCTYHAGTALFGRRAGLLAALSLAPALMFGVASRAATPDASLLFLITASLTAYVVFAFPRRGGDNEPRFPPFSQAALVYGLMALAVLAKGPVGVVLPVAIIATSLWATRFVSAKGSLISMDLAGLRPRSLLCLILEMRPLTAVGMLLVVALPWYAWVGYRTEGEFLVGFFWDHNIRRATETMEGHQGPGLIFYPLTLLVGFFPGSVFLVPGCYDAWQRIRTQDRQSPALVFCLVWVTAFVVVFSLAKTKLPSYVTPCYPALALLVGCLLDRWTADSLAISRGWLRCGIAWQIGVGLLVGVAVFWAAGIYLPGEQWLCALGTVLVVGGAASLWFEGRQQTARAAALSLGGGALFSFLLFGLGPAAADRHQQSHLLLAALNPDDRPAEVAAYHCLEPSWVFYFRHPIQELSSDETARAHLAGPGERRLILRERDYRTLADTLPPEVKILARAPLFLKREKILVLGREDSTAQRRALPSRKLR